jgi:hypothetical protein
MAEARKDYRLIKYMLTEMDNDVVTATTLEQYGLTATSDYMNKANVLKLMQLSQKTLIRLIKWMK